MLANFRLEKILGMLVLLTIVAVLAERPILEKSFVIEPESGYNVFLYDDAIAGGNSQAELLDDQRYHWRCQLKPQYAYAHCGFEVLFDDQSQQGLDFRDYDSLRAWLDYRGPSQTVRFYLRNFDPAYSTVGDKVSTKYNQVEFNTRLLDEGPVEFSLSDFFVANWWFLEYRISPRLGHPQFDNVVIFEVQTGTDWAEGEHEFRLRRVELLGQHLKTEDWYLIIMGAWMAAILLFLGYRILLLNTEVSRRRKREQELMEINSLLDARGRELEEKAKTDALTGAFNRDGIEEAIRLGLWEWRNHNKPLSIVMMDVDHFKSVNDLHGHAVGDRVLTALSGLVQNHIRTSDLFARWGGEEFVLVCRDTSIQYAAQLADKLRELIGQQVFDNGLQVTVSFGVASLHARESLEQLFHRADEALYEAKRRGRNRVVIEDELPGGLA